MEKTNPLLEFGAGAPISIRWDTLQGYHRETRAPGAPLDDLPADIRQAIAAHWTPALVAEWEEALNVPLFPIGADSVIQERARRLALGFDYDFGDERGVHHIGTTEADMRGWDEVTMLASALLALGDTTSMITIVTETGPAEVTAVEWQQVLVAAAQFRQPIWAASFALQQMEPIPENFADDQWWL